MAKSFRVISNTSKADTASMPSGLDKHGQTLWRNVMAEYAITDIGGRETLFQVCAAADMAGRCRECIDKDGELVKTKSGFKEHPLIKAELMYRSFVVRGLQKLGLNFEPVRSTAGRPGYA